MDVDGTLTDGKVYMGVDGEFFKAFDIKDGYALHTILKENGIVPVIITARKSPMVEHRCKELGVTEIHQGVMNKLDCLEKIVMNYSSEETTYDFSNVAYIGDDLLDLQCMNPIKMAGGVVGCPSNAAKELLTVSDFNSPHKGGEGAVRDFVEYIINYNSRQSSFLKESFKDRLQYAIEYISKLIFTDLKVGKYVVDDDFFYIVQEYNSFDKEVAQYESHRKYVDIQWLYEGVEQLLVSNTEGMTACDEYDEKNDVIHYHDNNNMSAIYLAPGSCAVLFPKNAHKPSRFLDQVCIVKKVVGKLKIV